jgi:hypothetical protein
VLALFLLLASPVPAEPPAGNVTIAADAEARWVPFTLTPGNQILFDATLDGRKVSAILDTGVSVTLLARTSAALVPAKVKAGGTAAAIGGAVPIGWMATGRISFGGVERRGGSVAVAALPAAATGRTEAVDLLVGRDLLAKGALDIDFANRRFRVLPSGRLPFAGATAPLTISRERRVYETRMTLGTRRLAPVVVDTGDGASVTIAAPEWRAAALPGVTSTSAIGFGLAGPLVTDLAIVPSLKLGTLTTGEVELRVEPAGGFSQAIGVAGRIGSSFLQHYRVLLDPGAGRMVLRLDDPKPPLRSTSGILLGVAKDRLNVLHVMRGGPAAAAGWRAGETICAIDGVPVPADYAENRMAAWSIGAPGTVVRLKLCGGEERRLTLRRFY